MRGYKLAVRAGLAGVLAASAGSAHAQIQWKSEPSKTVTVPSTDDVGGVIAALSSAERTGAAVRMVVQARGPVTDADRAALEHAGVRLLSPLGNHAHFASVDIAALDAPGVNKAGVLAGAMPIQASWKLDPRLAGGDLARLWGGVVVDGEDPTVPVTVYLFADVATDGPSIKMLESHGGRVTGVSSALPLVVMEIPASRVAGLVREADVQWVEPAMPSLGTTNAENRALTQVNTLQASPYGLTGTGVTAFVFDGGTVRPTHNDFGGRVTLVDSDFMSGHATHVAATIGGSGIASAGINRGMATGVQILSAGVSTSGAGWLYSNPTDIETDYAAAWAQGADVANNSIGTNTASNGFDCSWEGDYPAVSAVIDTIARGDSAAVTGGNPLLICWAGGNERSTGRCGALYNTIGPPAGSKNPMIVGAVNSNDDSMTSFSGWGPTDDGRMKPDFCAPGCQVGGDNGVTSASDGSNTAYMSLCGTSMATPTTTGIVALMLEDYRTRFPGMADPRNSTMKALLAHSAVDLGNPGPDYQFGYGSIRAQAAVELMRTGVAQERPLGPGEIQQYTVTVAAGTGPLVVTAGWDDPAGTPNVGLALVNNIDLQIVGPDGAVYHPWTLNPATPGAPAVRTAANTRDNLEQVRIDNPAPGDYTVRVMGLGVQQGLQPYSIVGSLPLVFGGGRPTVIVTPLQMAPVFQPTGAETPVSASVYVSSDELVPGSVRVYYRTQASGPFNSVEMTHGAGNLWTGVIPGMPCDASPQYYFSAEGDVSGIVASPGNAPTEVYAFGIDAFVTVRTDTMETANGWALAPSPDPVTTGGWERVDPQFTDQQPGDDHSDPGTICWITGGSAGASVGSFDVDSGETRLLSPRLDMTGMVNPRVGYWRWYHNGTSSTADDPFDVHISNDDGATWTLLERVGPMGDQTNGGWIRAAFAVSEFVAPTSSVRVRFTASDYGTAHVVEAAIDDFFVQSFACNPCRADFNGDGFMDFFDYNAFVGCFETGECPAGRNADFNNDGFADFFDYDAYVGAFEAGC